MKKGFFETLQEVALGVSLAILIPLVTYNGIGILFPTQSWDDYSEQHKKPTRDEYNEYIKPYEQAHNQAKFYASLAIGLVCIIVGAFTKITSLGFGFIFGGVSLLVTGYSTYWDNLSKHIRFFSLLTALVIIIAMAYLLMRKRNE